MCIRDSLERALDQPAEGAEEEVDHAGRGRDRELVEGHGDRCLLYTSDAADERSSVDLGGRRIIKKKNQETNDDCSTHYTIQINYMMQRVHKEICRKENTRS